MKAEMRQKTRDQKEGNRFIHCDIKRDRKRRVQLQQEKTWRNKTKGTSQAVCRTGTNHPFYCQEQIWELLIGH